MIDLVIEGVEVREAADGSRLIVVACLLTQNGSLPQRHAISFPDETLEWMVAEYGLDPTNVDAIIEMVILEGFMPPLLPDGERFTLYRADDIATARTYHQARVTGVRSQVNIVRTPRPIGLDRTSGVAAMATPEEHFATIRAACEIDPDVVDIKRTLVRKQRDRHRERFSKQASVTTRRERAERRLELIEQKEGLNRGNNNN